MTDFIRRNKEEIITGFIFIFFALGFNIYRVQGDGWSYYSFLENILHIPNPESAPGYFQGFQQSGCAYLNIPFYLLAYAIENLFNIRCNFNGITLRQISINLASNFYMLLSIILVIKILKKINFKHIIISVLSILFSTTAFAAAVVVPSWTHAADIFICTLFIYLLVVGESSPSRLFWAGIVYIIAILIRYFNAILLILLFMLRDYKKIRYFIMAVIGFTWVIPLIFYTYNGSAWNFSYLMKFTKNPADMITVGGIYTMNIFPVYFLKYLVHPLHGLFVWSPVTILSALGLVAMPKGREKMGYLFLGTWLSFLILHGYFNQWSAGWSFSNRYLVGLFPIYVIGLAAFLEKYGRKMVFLAVILMLYSVILYLNWHLCIMNGEFGTPADMVQAWIKGESDTSVDKKVDIVTVLKRLYEMCRYKYLIKIF